MCQCCTLQNVINDFIGMLLLLFGRDVTHIMMIRPLRYIGICFLFLLFYFICIFFSFCIYILYVHVCMYACMSVCIDIYKHTYIHIHKQTDIQIDITREILYLIILKASASIKAVAVALAGKKTRNLLLASGRLRRCSSGLST